MRHLLIMSLLWFYSAYALGQEQAKPLYMKICSQSEHIFSTEGAEKALNYMKENQSLFDGNNELEVFYWYYISSVYAQLGGLYDISLPLLEKTISIIDTEKDSFFTKENAQFLRVYYWLAVAQAHNGIDKLNVSKSLLKSKSIYEIAGLQDNEVYTQIINDINYLDSNLDNEINTAIQYTMKGNHQVVIISMEDFLKKLDLDKVQHISYHAIAKQLIGNSYVNLGETHKAQLLYLEEIKFLESIGQTGIEPYRSICDALSVVYNQIHNYEEAFHYGMKAKSAFEKAQSYKLPYARCLANLSVTLHNKNQDALAKMYMDIALDVFDKEFTLCVQSMKTSTDTTKTEMISDENYVLTYIEPLIVMLSSASSIYESVGCIPEAISAIKRSIELSKQYNLNSCYPLNNLAFFYLRNSQYKEASEYYKEAEKYAVSNYEKNEIGLNIALSQYLSFDMNAGNTAIKYSKEFNNSINNDFPLLTKEERDYYWKHYRYYLPMFNWFISTKDSTSGVIYNNVIQSKGMLLRTYLDIQRAVQASNDTFLKEKHNKLQSLRSNYNKTASKSEVIKKEIENLDRDITNALHINRKQTSWEDIKDALSDNEVAIEFTNIPKPLCKPDSIHKLQSEPRYCALVLKKSYDHPHIVELCTEKDFCSVSDSSYYTTTELYNLFWNPLKKEIGTSTTIYYSPDRYMSTVALENVLCEDGRRISQNKQLIRVSSTSEILKKEPQTKNSHYTLIGGIKYSLDKDSYIKKNNENRVTRSFKSINNRGSLDDISAETMNEVKNISSLLTHNNIHANLLVGSNATESYFKSLSGKMIDVLHIATHGFFWSTDNDDNSLIRKHIRKIPTTINEDYGVQHSGLLLTGAKLTIDNESLPDSIDDGILTGSEIENLNLSSINLIVLSACQTGLGEIEPIEGVFGLQRAFKKAGVKSILMTLWKVDDEATQMFMTEFYRDYLETNSKQHALKEAQKYLQTFVEDGVNKFADPYYWAGFVLLDALN